MNLTYRSLLPRKKHNNSDMIICREISVYFFQFFLSLSHLYYSNADVAPSTLQGLRILSLTHQKVKEIRKIDKKYNLNCEKIWVAVKRTLSFLLKRIYKTEELYLENLQRNVLAKEKEKKKTSQNDLQDSDGTQEINFSLTYCQPDPSYHNLPHIQM